MNAFERHESNVRSYVRAFPKVFASAKGSRLIDRGGQSYIDFFAGAGALNYGHNDDGMKQRLLEYVSGDGVVHSLDMATAAKETFIERFHEVILAPRGMPHRMLFPGPTGTNTVESALKLARKVTGRSAVVSFTNAFHGMTLGSLAVTGNAFKRSGAGLPLGNTIFMPYDGYMGEGADTLAFFEQGLSDRGSGVDLPAACIVETVQGEGGINAASMDWLRRLQAMCRRWKMLLIIDDVQAGCGRTGTFFSFEPAGLDPDIVCLSKALSGFGLPLAMTLVKPEYDCFQPGEHNGTFRGHNLAFVTGAEALRFWRDDRLAMGVARKAAIVRSAFSEIAAMVPHLVPQPRGRGLMQGLALNSGEVAERICSEAFRNGLVLETSGPDGEVLKCLCALTIPDEDLRQGFAILKDAVSAVAGRHSDTLAQPARTAA